jgi:hypothetical protein
MGCKDGNVEKAVDAEVKNMVDKPKNEVNKEFDRKFKDKEV